MPEATARTSGRPPFRCKVLKPPRDFAERERVVAYPPIDVVAGVIRRDGLLLITQRMPGDTLGGYWEFPGGKVDAGEEKRDALRRELREEIGVEVEIGRELERSTHTYPDRDVRLFFFEAFLRSGEPRCLEVADLRWVKPEELADYDFPPADRPLLERLMRGESTVE